MFGLVFSCFDTALLFRQRGCRVCKRQFKSYESIQQRDGVSAECCRDRSSCVCKSACGKWCTTIMDVIRILVLETIYYPNLLLKVFMLIVQQADDNSSFKVIVIHWFAASVSFLSILILSI